MFFLQPIEKEKIMDKKSKTEELPKVLSIASEVVRSQLAEKQCKIMDSMEEGKLTPIEGIGICMAGVQKLLMSNITAMGGLVSEEILSRMIDSIANDLIDMKEDLLEKKDKESEQKEKAEPKENPIADSENDLSDMQKLSVDNSNAIAQKCANVCNEAIVEVSSKGLDEKNAYLSSISGVKHLMFSQLRAYKTELSKDDLEFIIEDLCFELQTNFKK